MKTLISFLLGIGLGLTAFAQSSTIRPKHFVESYSKFPNADAVIILDSCALNATNGPFEFYRLVRIHILSDAAADLANVTLPQHLEYESYIGLRGRSYNLVNGKVEKSTIHRKQMFKNDISDEFAEISMAIPKVKKGTIIEYSYSLTDQYTFGTEWYFQNAYPTIRSCFLFQQGQYAAYNWFLRGSFIKQTKVYQVGNNVEFIHYNLPPAKEESFIPNVDDYRPRVILQLTEYLSRDGVVKQLLSDWPSADKDLLKRKAYTQFTKGNKDLLKSLDIGSLRKNTPYESMKSVFDFVQEKTEWDGKFRMEVDRKLYLVYRDVTGNSGEINQLLLFLLQKVGVPAKPMIISTRENGDVDRQYPIINQFNTMVVYVKLAEKVYVLDAASSLAIVDCAPSYLLNQYGRVLDEKGAGFWHKVQCSEMASESIIGQIEIRPSGEWSGSFDKIEKGYYAISSRLKGNEKQQESLQEDLPSCELTDWAIEGKSNTYEAVKTSYKINGSDYISVTGDKIYIKPWLHLAWEENPFDAPKRIFPIDFGMKGTRRISFLIKIPEGYLVQDYPQPARVNFPKDEMSYEFKLEEAEGSLIVSSIFTINQTEFAPENYKSLKRLYDVIMQKQGGQIVLVKNTSR